MKSFVDLKGKLEFAQMFQAIDMDCNSIVTWHLIYPKLLFHINEMHWIK